MFLQLEVRNDIGRAMKKIKQMAKNILTCIYHPIVSVNFLLRGSRNFVIGPQMTINTLNKFYIGIGVSIGRNSRFLLVKNYHGASYNPRIMIDDGVCIGNRFSALSAAPIHIGKNALIASDVLITSENHGMNPEVSESYADIPLTVASVELGDGCWIGEKVCILPGVTIGERSIVAAGSVVTKSVPSYTIVGGVPAKILKRYSFKTHSWEKT